MTFNIRILLKAIGALVIATDCQPELRRRIHSPQWKEIPGNPEPQRGRAHN